MHEPTKTQMIYIGYLLMCFILIRLLVAFINYLSFHYLPVSANLNGTPMVSILIPARNEEQNINALLNQLSNFAYAEKEIIVYNDNSSDRTSEIVQMHIQNNKEISIIEGDEPVSGWLGKNYACYHLAQKAKGEFLLFLDADVMVQDGLIERALTYAQKHKLQLLSIFPKQIFKSYGERISVPLMNWILLSFLPLILVRTSKNPAFSAANGQFMMFRSKAYQETQPHKLFRMHKVEDIAIIQFFKKITYKSDTLLGNNYIQCRMYSSLKEAVTGFSKNIFQFFGNSMLLTVFVGLLTTLAPFAVLELLGVRLTIVYLFAAILIRVFVSLASKQSIALNILLTLPQQLVFIYFILQGIVKHKQKELIWKGRNIL